MRVLLVLLIFIAGCHEKEDKNYLSCKSTVGCKASGSKNLLYCDRPNGSYCVCHAVHKTGTCYPGGKK